MIDTKEGLRVSCGDNSPLFEQGRYVIPLYQRAYAWRDREILQLIDDICDIESDREKYYLGSLIVAKKSNYYEVIDGQQRLTTLYLLLHALGIHTPDRALSFACREKSNTTLYHIDQLLDPVESRLLEEKILEDSILDGLQTILRKLQEPEFDRAGLKEKLNRVRIYRIDVPPHTDLNRYFEIMNTRGEQLEQHDILKASLMETLKGEEQEAFSKIWNACSDMTGYVQMHFDVSKRALLFSCGWDKLPKDGSVHELTKKIVQEKEEKEKEKKEKEKKEKGQDKRLIKEIIIARELSSETADGTSEEGDRIRFESIIEFPYFLLHALRVFISITKIKHNTPGMELTEKPLDDKKLISAFDRVLENGVIDGHQINPHDFSIRFINFLLQLRFVFDQFIIKREFTNDDTTGAWSLKKLCVSGKNKRAYYTNTTYTILWEHDQGKKAVRRNRKLLMLQACLRVSYTSPKNMHWITKLLEWLCENNYTNLSKIDNYEAVEEKIAQEAVDKLFLTPGDFNQGVNTPHIVLNYLDYLLWKRSDERDDFDFEFRNSVEHWYPRNPSEGTFEQWTHEEGVDRFGNLCLIQRAANSKFSNLAPEAKKANYPNMIAKGSLKLRQMASLTVAGEGKDSSQRWKDSVVLQHEKEMLELLKNACEQRMTGTER